jgi:FdhD protein
VSALPEKPDAGVRQVRIRRAGEAGEQDDVVAVEEPLEIRLAYAANGSRRQQSISITMRTPGDDVELAVGFLLGEGIIGGPGSVERAYGCGPPAPGSGAQNVVRVDLTDDTAVDIDRLQRNFYATSSCGVCGKRSLDALHVQGASPVTGDGFSVSGAALRALPARARARQRNFASTGGIHASATFDAAGDVRGLYEDVGRHNALDKLIGASVLNGAVPMHDRGILVSGRASFELVQKAMMAGCPMLAAVGAPSSLAVDAAREFNLTLVGFLGPQRFNVYAGAERIAD